MEGRFPLLRDHFPYLAKKRIMLAPGHVGYKGIGASSIGGEYYTNPDSCRTGTHTSRNYNEEQLNSYIVADTLAVLEHTFATARLCCGPFAHKAAYAEDWQPDAFIEVHCNAFHKPEADGFEIWHYGDDESVLLAKEIAKKMMSYTPIRFRAVKDMQVTGAEDEWKRQHNALFRNVTTRPLVLLECGFLTNPDDAAWLTNLANHERIASAIVHGANGFFSFKANGNDDAGTGGGENPSSPA